MRNGDGATGVAGVVPKGEGNMQHSTASRRLRVVGLLAVAGLAATLLHSPVASAATDRWVDPAAAAATPGTGCGTDAGYSTIQAAITAAAAGDTINVCPGTYAGPISINKANLTLKGAKAGIPAGPSAAPAGRGTDESIIESAGTNVLTWTGSATTNTTVDGFTLRNIGVGRGITLATSGHVITNNIIEYAGGPTTDAQQSGIIGGVFNGLLMKGNRISGFRYGFNLQSGNLTHAPSTIDSNHVSGFAVAGIVFGSNTASGQVVTNNTFTSPDPTTGPAGITMPLLPIEIRNNTLTGAGAGIGINFIAGTRSGVVIEGNTISGWSRGISHPNVNGTTNPWPVGSTPTEVHQNNITGNSTYGIFNSTLPGEYDVNATCNWWGAASGPRTTFSGPGDRVSLGVSSTPWLMGPAPASDCTGGMLNPTAQFTPSTNAGDAPLPVDFDATASNDLDGTIVSYAWDFGDGNTGSGATTSHTYATPGEYVVTLTVTDNHGRTGQAAETISVTRPQAAPTAAASATPGTGPAPLVVTLDGTGSSDSDGTIVSYEWDLGDGNTATGPTVSHVYGTPGTYVATLTVTDDDGLTAQSQVAIQVNPVPQPQSDNDCKKNGWQAYGFSNQGQCIRYVNTGKDSRIGQ